MNLDHAQERHVIFYAHCDRDCAFNLAWIEQEYPQIQQAIKIISYLNRNRQKIGAAIKITKAYSAATKHQIQSPITDEINIPNEVESALLITELQWDMEDFNFQV